MTVALRPHEDYNLAGDSVDRRLLLMNLNGFADLLLPMAEKIQRWRKRSDDAEGYVEPAYDPDRKLHFLINTMTILTEQAQRRIKTKWLATLKINNEYKSYQQMDEYAKNLWSSL